MLFKFKVVNIPNNYNKHNRLQLMMKFNKVDNMDFTSLVMTKCISNIRVGLNNNNRNTNQINSFFKYSLSCFSKHISHSRTSIKSNKTKLETKTNSTLIK